MGEVISHSGVRHSMNPRVRANPQCLSDRAPPTPHLTSLPLDHNSTLPFNDSEVTSHSGVRHSMNPRVRANPQFFPKPPDA